MIYTLSQLCDDVLARMGEAVPTASPSVLPGAMSVSAAVERKVRVLLPSVGKGLILESRGVMLSGAENHRVQATMRRMPCGLYAAVMSLPEDTLRVVSVKMGSWSGSVEDLEDAATSGYSRQWSPERAIAGDPERPKAYLSHTAGGMTVTAVGSESVGDMPEHLLLWRVPGVDVEGKFRFPASLYPELVDRISL